MRFFPLVLAGLFLIMAASAVFAATDDCQDGTKYFKCSTSSSYVGFRCGPMGLARDLTCKCEDVLGYVIQGTGDDSMCVLAKCVDGTDAGQCAKVQPKVCIGGPNYADNATKCGCPSGKKISSSGIFCEFLPCNDGGTNVSEGTCSPKSPGKKCVSGQLVDKASDCPCPSSMKKVGETCGIYCEDGTKDGNCSTLTLPKKCVNGYLLDDAAKCGCPSGKTAVGKQCTDSVFGNFGSGADLLGGAQTGNQTSDGTGGASAFSCCCLPTALIGVIGGFAFFRKKEE